MRSGARTQTHVQILPGRGQRQHRRGPMHRTPRSGPIIVFTQIYERPHLCDVAQQVQVKGNEVAGMSAEDVVRLLDTASSNEVIVTRIICRVVLVCQRLSLLAGSHCLIEIYRQLCRRCDSCALATRCAGSHLAHLSFCDPSGSLASLLFRPFLLQSTQALLSTRLNQQVTKMWFSFCVGLTLWYRRQ